MDLQFNAIGLAVNSKARSQLQCIAKAGDGNYYDADNTSDLEDAVRRITQRALRPFQTSGTPVEGTVDQAGAPSIRVGQYKDSYDAGNTPATTGSPGRPGPVTASISTIVRPYPSQNTENWTLTWRPRTGRRAPPPPRPQVATGPPPCSAVPSCPARSTRSPGRPRPNRAPAHRAAALARPELAAGQRGRGVGGGADRGSRRSATWRPAGARRRLHRHGGAVRAATPSPSRLGGVLLQLHRGQAGHLADSVATGRPSSTAYVWRPGSGCG